MSETSLYWREDGNKNYVAAGTASTLTSAADYLKIAIDAYEKAANLAKNDEERCYALRNLGMANWHMGKNCNKQAEAAAAVKIGGGNRYHYDVSHRAEYGPHFMIYFYKEAINAFVRCLPICARPEPDVRSAKRAKVEPGRKGSAKKAAKKEMPDNYDEKVNKNLKECAEEALAFLTNMDYFSSYKTRAEQLERLADACGTDSNDWAAIFQLEVAKTYRKWAMTELERSKDYAAALNCLQKCYTPFEKIDAILRPMSLGIPAIQRGRKRKNAGFGQFTSQHREEYIGLVDTVKINTRMAEARRFIEQGDDIWKKAALDSKELNVDLVHNAIDAFCEAVATVYKMSEFSLEAEAHSKIGQIYYNVLKNETHARVNCLQSMKLAGMVEHQNFAGIEWYDKAAAILKQIQDGVRKSEEEEVRKNREPFMKNIKKELAQIEKLGDLSAEKLIGECLQQFPPKHKKGSNVIEELTKKKFDDDTPRSDVKKCLSKLILLYHPDHVDIKEHGGEYFVLCEEITKQITRKYECFKG